MSKLKKVEDMQVLSNLAIDFHDLVSDKDLLHTSTENFISNVIDELILGIVFDLHRKYKTKSYEVEAEEDDDEESSEGDFLTMQQDFKKAQVCVCPICDRAVVATKFAPHLEVCMGMGRNGRVRSRNAVRRAASICSKDSGYPSDNEDDIEWGPESKRGKKKKRNGLKKSKGGTPKKSNDSAKLLDSMCVEVDGEDNDLSSLRDLLQDHSNSSSPADSLPGNQTNISKQQKGERSKSKKSRRDRSSPSSSVSAD